MDDIDVVVVPAGMLDAEYRDLHLKQLSETVQCDEAVCQICLETVPPRNFVTRLCGSTCLAKICESCLVQHLTTTVYSFYPGVLPKVRCPICLTLMNKGQWEKFVAPASIPPAGHAPLAGDSQAGKTDERRDGIDRAPSKPSTTASVDDGKQKPVDDNAHVLEKYSLLCRQSCGFQSPCCHVRDYTMLPPPSMDAEEIKLALTRSEADAVPAFIDSCRAFCRHQEDAKAVFDRLADVAHGDAERVLWWLLPRIEDEERRATLLLHHLFLHPNTETRCCKRPVCFKCKAAGHHSGACRDFVETESMIECPGCHVTIVKIDGCSTLTCLCGFSFNWELELQQRRGQLQRIAPTDVEFDEWRGWHSQLRASFPLIATEAATRSRLRERTNTMHARPHRRLVAAVKAGARALFRRRRKDRAGANWSV